MSRPTHVQRCREWIQEQIEALGSLRTANSRDLNFKSWRQNTVTAIQRIWPEDRERVERFRRISFTPPNARGDGKQLREWFGKGIAESRAYLNMLLEVIEREGVPQSADGERARDAEDFEDEVGFPMLDLDEAGHASAHAPAPAAPAPVASGELSVTAGYDAPETTADLARDPSAPAPPALHARQPGTPADATPPSLAVPADAPPPAAEARPAVEIPRVPERGATAVTPPAPAPEAPQAESAPPRLPADVVGGPIAARTTEPESEDEAPALAPARLPADRLPAPPRPLVAKAAEAPPAAAKPVEAKAAPSPPAAAKPVEAKPAPSPPAAAKPVDTRAASEAPARSSRSASSASIPRPALAAQGRVVTSNGKRENGKGKNGKGKGRKARGKLRDMLGLDEFESRAHEAESALARTLPAAAEPVATPPAPVEAPTPAAPAAVEAPAPVAAMPPASVEPPAAIAPPPVAATPVAPAPPVAVEPPAAVAPPPVAAAPKAAEPPAPATLEEDEAESIDDETLERARLDFMQNSPVFGVVGKPVQRRSDTTEFLDPDAVAVASLVDDLGRLGVPDALKPSTAARLVDVARHLEEGTLDWALLRSIVNDAMQYPELARRLLPVLLPWLERAA